MGAMLPDFVEKTMNNFLKGMAFCLLGSVALQTAHAAALDVEIVSRVDGRVLPAWHHQGKLWVAGNPGEAYAVRLANRSGGRLLAVLSIDGVNAVSGETASFRQSGYVLDAGGSADIRGWRKSLDDVAQFTFTRLSDSYAARTGRPDNVGVIGVAVYREAVAPQVWRQDGRLAARAKEAPAGAPPAPAQSAGAANDMGRADAARAPAEAEERLGTGHGAREHDPTRYTEFRRASSSPAETIVIHYDSYSNLLARGIAPREPRYSAPRPHPNPFPGQFVPDPQG
jgi:hypothetical protein